MPVPHISNVQEVNQRLRKKYGDLPDPLLLTMVKMYGLSISGFAKVFGIGVQQAGEVLRHERFPDYVLAVRIARYFDLDTDTLFGWRVDDDGFRSPLIIRLPGIKAPVKLSVMHGVYRMELLEKIQKAQKEGKRGMESLVRKIMKFKEEEVAS